MHFSPLALVLSSLSLAACASSSLHVQGNPAAVAETPGSAELSVAPGAVRFRADLCGDSARRPDYTTLDVAAVVAHFEQQGMRVSVSRARLDLAYADVEGTGVGGKVRFRVAILPTAGAAGRELHEALLQHGEGTWGVHRANLAVLAPRASLEDVLVFAAKTRLACWGVVTVAGRDDTYVVPGGYTEL